MISPNRMLRRPPTTLTLTSEDVKAYEDRREAEAFKHLSAVAYQQHHAHAHQQRRQLPPPHNQLARSLSGMDLTGITTSSSSDGEGGAHDGDEDVSYYPSRYRPSATAGDREEEEDDEDEEIYRNEVDRSSSESERDDSDGAMVGERGFGQHDDVEDEVMRELDPADLDGAGDMNVDAAHQQQQQHHHHRFGYDDDDIDYDDAPPPAPSRLVPGMRGTSREPAAAAAAAHQAQHGAGRYGGSRAQQAQRRGGAAAEAVTPTPGAHVAQLEAIERVRAARAAAMVTPGAPARATRSREERIGVARGGGRR